VIALPIDPLDLVIAGVGGQGNVLASEILGTAAVEAGFFVAIGETYGASQRGGSVSSHVRISGRSQPGPLIPRGQARLILGFEPMEALRVARELAHPEAHALVETGPIPPLAVLRGDASLPDVREILAALRQGVAELRVVALHDAALRLGNPQSFNILVIGALSATGWLPFPLDLLDLAVRRLFPKEKVPVNLLALRRGAEAPAALL
jgi:indolepyruvate ferredoxin oxidoreductase, beta subunit